MRLINNVEIPMVGFGAYQLRDQGGLTPKEILLTAMQTGYRLFDLAFYYHVDDAFRSALDQAQLLRNQVFIVHKIWNVDFELATSYQATLTQFQTTLHKLKTSYLDLLLLHMPQDNALICWRALETLYEQGLVKAIGVCNFNLPQLQSFCAQVKIPPMVLQTQVSPWVYPRQVISYCQANKIVVMGWGTMGRGNFSCLRTPLILDLARKYHTEPAHIALQWLVQKEVIIIPSSRKPWRIKSNWQQVNQFQLSPMAIRAIDDLPQREPYLTSVSLLRHKVDFTGPSWDRKPKS